MLNDQLTDYFNQKSMREDQSNAFKELVTVIREDYQKYEKLNPRNKYNPFSENRKIKQIMKMYADYKKPLDTLKSQLMTINKNYGAVSNREDCVMESESGSGEGENGGTDRKLVVS